MLTIIAVAHILGAVIVLIAFGFVTLLLSSWELERNKKAAVQDASISLGIPIAELDDPKHQQRITQFVAERSSSELLRNRLSDLCGFVQIGWGWLSNLIQAGVLLSVIWTSVADDPANGVYAWSIVAVAFFFWISSVIFGLCCKLVTGRYPGQARQARKILAEGSGAVGSPVQS
jgi:hypothetical protein